MNILRFSFISVLSLLFVSCGGEDSDDNPIKEFAFTEISIDGNTNQSSYTNVDPTSTIYLKFTDYIDANSINDNIKIKDQSGQLLSCNPVYDGSYIIAIEGEAILKSFSKYQLVILTNLKSKSGVKIFTGKTFDISTSMDLSDKFPRISDEELLDLVQKQTFSYFWDFGHPTSGMARERTTSGNVVTTGGTGFGIMAMIVAAKREFISRSDALARIQKIVTFLDTKCTNYHGAYAHWIDGATGETKPFSQYDDGADLVETALLFQGLLTARQYFNSADISETTLRTDITRLWEAIDWTWFQKDNENVLYWHWSPNVGWQMNLKISGWNESLIVYALAASSPTHPIAKSVYDEGWTRNGAFVNNKSFYGYELPLGSDYGGPLFLSQYSFLGINPRGLTDSYTNYEVQNKNHTLINYNYCIQNPKGYRGYSADCWGLTASDGNTGYSAHSPTNDKGVIAPTAALSAMPYTPEESMKALHFFYYKLGDKLWSQYGFFDAFNLSAQWFDNQHIAIDQGPIIVMIENYRSGLLWSLFMSDPEIKAGLTKLGFGSPSI